MKKILGLLMLFAATSAFAFGGGHAGGGHSSGGHSSAHASGEAHVATESHAAETSAYSLDGRRTSSSMPYVSGHGSAASTASSASATETVTPLRNLFRLSGLPVIVILGLLAFLFPIAMDWFESQPE